MKKLMQFIKEEVVPLSRKQNIVLITIIACIFQFVLFYAPALADQAVAEAQAAEVSEEIVVSNDPLFKNLAMDPEAAKHRPNNESIILSAQAAELEKSTSIVIIDQVASSSELTIIGPINKSAPQYKVTKTSTHTLTAYNSEVGQTDDSPCITANGFNVCQHGIEDTIAANFLPMGTKIRIPDLFGDRIFIVRDRMNRKHPNRVDVWMLKYSDAIKFGIRTSKIEILEEI